MKNNHCIHVLHDQWDDYELLDSGNRKKLERFGQFIVVRGEPKAWWPAEFPPGEWARAVAFHTGEEYGSWNFQTKLPREWLFHFDALTLQGRFATASKHIG